MAYAALVSLEQTIHQILNQDLYSTSTQEKHHLASLGTNVLSFQAFLDKFPKEAKNLEPRIRDAATAAEDVIECFMLEQVRGCCGCIMWIKALTGIKFEHKLNKVAEEMEAIAAEVVEIKNSVVIKDTKLGDSSIVDSSSPVLPAGKIDMVGSEDDLLEIKGRLVGESTKLQFLAISGMGGIGKTTLARNAYDDPLIQEHFDIRAWVTISQDYRAHEILSCLLDSMKELNPNGSKGMSVAEIADRIYKILYGRRYLIVMDDVWSTEVLDDVRKLFPDDGNRSRIILTTRISDVAAYGKSSPHQMRLMDEEKSWDLLKQKIGGDILSDELEMIGHEIARSCRGLPLAVVVIAGILSSISETPASWAEVAKNMKMATSKDDRMDELVSLGYNHLPHRLRACLLYMGLLPEDYSIRVSLLVKLWMAEGFLKHPKDSSKSLESDAEEHLEDLVRRNLILATQRKYNGKIKSCSLHDMVRETCIRLLKEENHLRHVTTNYNQVDDRSDISTRSVLIIGRIEDGCFDHCRLLRVLHVPLNSYDTRLLSGHHLRYLCFFYSRPLPADMSRFRNLQSLIISGPFSIFDRLPSSIWKLRQLRHLIIRRGCFPAARCCRLRSAPVLENLQTLKEVVYDERDEACSLLKRFPNLIKLGLTLLPEVNYAEDFLVCLHQLEKLRIWCIDPERHFSAVIPGWLKKFTLRHGIASASLLEAIGSLPNLQVLKLMECVFDDATWEVRGGEFPKLEKLQLSELEGITTFIVEDSSTAFPKLNCLLIHRCYHLVELSDEIGDIPTLELIEVSHSGIGVCDWARRVQENQESYENETLQVRCVRPEPGMLPRRYWETLMHRRSNKNADQESGQNIQSLIDS